MRIQEEQDRRKREAQILARLPRVLEETHRHLPGASRPMWALSNGKRDQLPTMEELTRRIVDRAYFAAA
jgi:hypothetical protein